MKNHAFRGIFSLLILCSTTSPVSGQHSEHTTVGGPDTGSCFLYVDYCGIRFNKSIQKQELIISVVKMPAHLLNKMPRLKKDGQYSSRNRKIYQKQQEIVRRYGNSKVVLRINKRGYHSFYPKRLRRGYIIDNEEFSRWNFIEKPIPELPPVKDGKKPEIKEKWWNGFDWRWEVTDPMNINCGLLRMT